MDNSINIIPVNRVDNKPLYQPFKSGPPLIPWYYHPIIQPWQQPGFWSEPTDLEAAVCIPYYETETPVFQFEVPATEIAVVTEISYDIDNAVLPDDSFFDIAVYRSGMLLERWRDFAIDNTNVNPAHRYAIGGHNRAVPFYGRLDHGDQITISMLIKGPKPFAKTPADPFGGQGKIIINGWRTLLRDTRSDAYKFITDGVDDYRNTSPAEVMKDLVRAAQRIEKIEPWLSHK